MSIEFVYINNDNLLEVQLQDGIDDSYINDATVSVSLVDSDGVDVVGETWPLTMAYVAASNGVYRATLADTLTIVDDAIYTATITANGGAGRQGEFKKKYFGNELYV